MECARTFECISIRKQMILTKKITYRSHWTMKILRHQWRRQHHYSNRPYPHKSHHQTIRSRFRLPKFITVTNVVTRHHSKAIWYVIVHIFVDTKFYDSQKDILLKKFDFFLDSTRKNRSYSRRSNANIIDWRR